MESIRKTEAHTEEERIADCVRQLEQAEFHTLLNMTFGDLIDAQALRFPNNDCVVDRGSGTRYTYAQFKAECDRLARGLMSIGVERGSHVAVWTENCVEWILLMYATAKIGAVLVTVNTNYKRYELEYLMHQSDSMTLVMCGGVKNNDYLPHLMQICPELSDSQPGKLQSEALPFLKNIITVGDFRAPCAYTWAEVMEMSEQVSEQERQSAQAAVHPHDVTNMQYTSGTTGFPKGVMLSHHSVINNGKSIGDRKALTPIDRECIPVPLFHCFGCVLGVTSCITHGSAIVLVKHFHPLHVMQAVQEEACTSLLGVPTMFISILSHPDFAQYDYSSLRTGIMSGSPCPVEIMRKVNVDMHMPEIVIAFGMTESSPVTTMTAVDDPLEKRVSTVGRCQPNVEIKLVDPDTGEEVPPGVPGEFLTRGYQIMKGYYKMPDATQQAIDGEGWLHTGDLCTVDTEGYYTVTGRLKDMIIRGGENIYPRELEEFLYTHMAVSDVQVVGVPDEKYGEEVLAFVILKQGKQSDEEELIEYVKGGLSRFKAPRYVRFLDTFPMTASGKIQKYKLRELGVELLNLQDSKASKATLGRGKSEDEATVTEYIVNAQKDGATEGMAEQLMQIGIRLRALREVSNITVSDLAGKIGMEVDDYEKYERGERDFSFSFLYKIAQTLNVDISDLMSGVSPRQSACSIVRAGRGLRVERRKTYAYTALAHDFRDKRVEPFLVTVESADMPLPHAHEGQEFQYLLQGEVDMIVGDDRFTLYPGDAVFYDSTAPHAIATRDGSPATFLAVLV